MSDLPVDDFSTNLDQYIHFGVEALYSFMKDFAAKKILQEGENVYLHVTLFKIPHVEETVKRTVILKHPPYAGNPDVCLIVPDCEKRDGIRRTSDDLIDSTVDRFKTILKRQKVTGITTIMPFRQLKEEYFQYESRRRLVHYYDVFLYTSSLNANNSFFNYFGKTFAKKRKYPISVRLPSLSARYNPQTQAKIKAAIASSSFYIKQGSDNYSIKVGNTYNEKRFLNENLRCVIHKIINNDLIPGGLSNIRIMGIKANRSKLIPLYISNASGNGILIPTVLPKIPLFKSVEGELSTIPGKRVTVLPSGEVFVNDMSNDVDMEEEKMTGNVERRGKSDKAKRAKEGKMLKMKRMNGGAPPTKKMKKKCNGN